MRTFKEEFVHGLNRNIIKVLEEESIESYSLPLRFEPQEVSDDGLFTFGVKGTGYNFTVKMKPNSRLVQLAVCSWQEFFDAISLIKFYHIKDNYITVWKSQSSIQEALIDLQMKKATLGSLTETFFQLFEEPADVPPQGEYVYLIFYQESYEGGIIYRAFVSREQVNDHLYDTKQGEISHEDFLTIENDESTLGNRIMLDEQTNYFLMAIPVGKSVTKFI